MSTAERADRCTYCSAQLVPGTQRLFRCPRCNLFLVRGADGMVPQQLDGVSHDYCPWCAFPVAREHSLPEQGEFVCPGCSGTLTADMLETQAAIERYRKRRLPGFAYLVFVVVLLAVIFLTWWWLRP
jgi:hypothetical protein